MAEAEFIYDVFISYSPQDEEWADKTLRVNLENAQLKVCIDYRDFLPGKPKILDILEAAENSRHTVLVMTPDWVAYEWTLYDGILTRTNDPAGLQRRTIPLILKRCDVPKFISMLTPVDFTRKDREDVAWQQLLRACDISIESISKMKKPLEIKSSDKKEPTVEEYYHQGTIDNDYTIRDFSEMLRPHSTKRIMHIWGDSMMGKSHLTKDVFPEIAKNIYSNVITTRIEFAGFETNETELLLRIRNSFPDPEKDCISFNKQYNNFINQTRGLPTRLSNRADIPVLRIELINAMTSALADDIRRCRKMNFVFLFDAVNEASSDIREWLLTQLFVYLQQLENTRTVVTSKEKLDLSQIRPNICQIYPLQLIQEAEPYVEYCQRQGITIKPDEIQTLIYAAGFKPGQFLTLVFTLQKNKQGLSNE